jgi:hypothetical protein
MPHDTTIVFGVPVPSVNPVFLAIVRFHIGLGIVVVVAGAIAMLSYKARDGIRREQSITGRWRSSSSRRPRCR